MLSGNLDHLTVFGNLSSFNGFVGQAALLSDPSNVLGLYRYGLFLEYLPDLDAAIQVQRASDSQALV